MLLRFKTNQNGKPNGTVRIFPSNLTPPIDTTYTTEGKEIITEDYIWIPSLTELSTKNKYIEGQPLEYWQKLLGNNAS